MTFRVPDRGLNGCLNGSKLRGSKLRGSEIDQFLAAADDGTLLGSDFSAQPARSFRNPVQCGLGSLALGAQTEDDGDCLRALGVALGIELSVAVIAYGAWRLLSLAL